MHRCAHSSTLIGNREHSALEFDGKARRRLEVTFKLILLRRAPRIVGEAGKYGKTVGERSEERVPRFKIFSRERGPFVRPPSRRICPHILDCGAHRIDICFWNAEPNELAVTVFEAGFGTEIVGVAHIDSFQSAGCILELTHKIAKRSKHGTDGTFTNFHCEKMESSIVRPRFPPILMPLNPTSSC